MIEGASAPPPRVVSLLPAATEIVCALGLESHLVGRSHECDFPPSVTRLPVCTSARIAADASSAEIDRQVRRLVRDALSIYEVDGERLRALRPDVVVTQTQCEVCAVGPADVERALGAWVGGSPRLVSLAPARLQDVWEDMRTVARELGRPERGERLASALRDRVARIASVSASLAARPSVALVEWIEPLMTAGHWGPELVRLAGGRSVWGHDGGPSERVEPHVLVELDPDVVVVAACGFDLPRTRAEMVATLHRPPWNALRAVRTGRLFVADGNHYFNRPGPRLVESLEILAEILHPRRFRFGHEGSGWQRI
ncbi:MAG: cobalamin-binding protein [Myxococcales bacterium]|nr:cobalamin-binding protein [Myxococcales bacterium]